MAEIEENSAAEAAKVGLTRAAFGLEVLARWEELGCEVDETWAKARRVKAVSAASAMRQCHATVAGGGFVS